MPSSRTGSHEAVLTDRYVVSQVAGGEAVLMERSFLEYFLVDNVGAHIHRYNRREGKKAASKIPIHPISPPHEQGQCPDNGESICVSLLANRKS
jgi:hypothetical protein